MTRTTLTDKSMRANKGFTLIELLIVIAIIAILAAILFPVFARARESARRSACQSNLKQWGLAFMQYNQDYDERFPLMGYDDNSVPPLPKASRWYNAVYAYTKSKGIQACPSDGTQTNVNVGNAELPDANGVPNMGRFSYLANDVLGGATLVSGTAVYKPASLATIATATELIVMTEGVRSFGLPYWAENVGCMITGANTPGNTDWAGPTCGDGVVPAADRPTLPRHFDGANFLFADGHVKWRKVADRDSSGNRVSQLEAVMPWARYVDPKQEFVNNPGSARKWQ